MCSKYYCIIICAYEFDYNIIGQILHNAINERTVLKIDWIYFFVFPNGIASLSEWKAGPSDVDVLNKQCDYIKTSKRLKFRIVKHNVLPIIMSTQ